MFFQANKSHKNKFKSAAFVNVFLMGDHLDRFFFSLASVMSHQTHRHKHTRTYISILDSAVVHRSVHQQRLYPWKELLYHQAAFFFFSSLSPNKKRMNAWARPEKRIYCRLYSNWLLRNLSGWITINTLCFPLRACFQGSLISPQSSGDDNSFL